MKKICFVIILASFLMCGCREQAQVVIASSSVASDTPNTPALDSITDKRIKDAIAEVCTGNGDPIKNLFYGNTSLIRTYSDNCLLFFEWQFANHYRWPGPLDGEGYEVARKIVETLKGQGVPSFIIYERNRPENPKDVKLMSIEVPGYTGGIVFSLIMRTMCNQREMLQKQGVYIVVPNGTPPCSEQ